MNHDVLGNEISAMNGPRVVYPVRHGSRVTMQTGYLVNGSGVCSCGAIQVNRSCKENTLRSMKVLKDNDKIVTLTAFKNVVVVK